MLPTNLSQVKATSFRGTQVAEEGPECAAAEPVGLHCGKLLVAGSVAKVELNCFFVVLDVLFQPPRCPVLQWEVGSMFDGV